MVIEKGIVVECVKPKGFVVITEGCGFNWACLGYRFVILLSLPCSCVLESNFPIKVLTGMGFSICFIKL